MGFDLAGMPLQSSSGLIAGSAPAMKLGLTGILQRYNPAQPMFRAGALGTIASVSIGAASTWDPVTSFTATNVNVNSCYNTANGRFTAPVAGIYLFSASAYWANAVTGNYVHASFWVNDSITVRKAGAVLRIKGYGDTAGYSQDGEAYEIISLAAGDYVTYYLYNAGANTHVPQYGRFEGYLLA